MICFVDPVLNPSFFCSIPCFVIPCLPLRNPCCNIPEICKNAGKGIGVLRCVGVGFGLCERMPQWLLETFQDYLLTITFIQI